MQRKRNGNISLENHGVVELDLSEGGENRVDFRLWKPGFRKGLNLCWGHLLQPLSSASEWGCWPTGGSAVTQTCVCCESCPTQQRRCFHSKANKSPAFLWVSQISAGLEDSAAVSCYCLELPSSPPLQRLPVGGPILRSQNSLIFTPWISNRVGGYSTTSRHPFLTASLNLHSEDSTSSRSREPQSSPLQRADTGEAEIHCKA